MFVQDICVTVGVYVDSMDFFVAYAHGYEERVPGVPTLQFGVLGGEVDVVDLSCQGFDVVVCLMSPTFLVWSVDHKHFVVAMLHLCVD